jgi:hypothetical protein
MFKPLKSVLDVECSMFYRVTDTTPKSVNLLQWLKDTTYLPQQNQVRAIADTEKQKEAKVKLMPGITPSGIFSKRGNSHLLKHTGLIAIDIDKKDNPDVEDFAALRNQLSKIPCVAYAALSVSGNGCWLLIPIAYPERHKEHFEFLEELFRKTLGLIIDDACKDVARLRFYSHDRGGRFNHKAKATRGIKKPQSVKPKHYQPKTFSGGDLPPWEQYNQSDEIFNLLQKHGWQIDHETSLKVRFTRPGKNGGTSACFHRGKRVFYVFTSSTEFKADKPYKPFSVYAILEHGGDKDKARTALSRGR